MQFHRFPQQSSRGLDFKTAEIVVLQLGAERQQQLFTGEPDFILQETAVEVDASGVRRESNVGVGCGGVGAVAVTQSPCQLMAGGCGDAVLQLKIHRSPPLAENRISPVIVVVVELQNGA